MYEEYYEKLVEKNVERQNEFENNIIFSHNGNNYYTNPRQIHGIKYNFVISNREDSVYETKGFIVEIYIDNNRYFKSHFNQLKVFKEEIETNIGQSLVWQERPTVCRVFAKLQVENIEDTTKWNEYIDWQINTMIKFLQVFPTYTANLTNEIDEGDKMLNIRIGDFVKNHLEKIVDYCKNNTSEIDNLMNREYSRNVLGIEANYSFLTLSNESIEARYWNTTYFINDVKYKFCSQLGGRNPIQNGLTRSQREGQRFLEYFKNKNILLEEYQNIEINFIVGGNSPINSPVFPNSYDIKNIILYGVPGVGKTHNINKLINLIEKNEDSEQEIFKKITQNDKSNEVLDDENLKSRVVFTTFHQSFAYEDFIEGFRPNNAGEIKLRDGIFKAICEDAKSDKYNNYYLVIDEINRGNISKIFGELITLIEESKRDKLEILLPYSQERFSVPSNLFIIGTMNSTDKSIALIDIALRRRFTFLELKPSETLIQNPHAKEFFKKLNEQLEDEYKIGHSYFMGENIDLEFVKEYKIKPLLKEYFYGNSEKMQKVIDDLF